MRTHADDDPFMTPQANEMCAIAYVPGSMRRDPLASPLLADLAGLPPLGVHVGGREILLDDGRRLVAAAHYAGLRAELRVWPGIWHIFPIHAGLNDLPEAAEAIGGIARFLRQHTSAFLAPSQGRP